MENRNETLEARMAEASARIKADSYQRIASVGGWAGGGRTLWAVAAIGAVMGAAIGVVAPFFPLIAGASSVATAVSAIPASVAVFAATGMTTGFSGGLLLGRISGVVAPVAQEQEKRLKEWTARQVLAQNPNARIVGDAPSPPPEKKSFWQRVKDGYHTYFNPRIGLTMAAIGVAGGLLLALGVIAAHGAMSPIMPALEHITRLGAETLAQPGVVAAYTAGVMGAFGALWSFNIPKITSDVTHFFGELIDGKYIGRQWGPPQKEAEKQQKTQAPEAEQPPLAATKEAPLTLRQFTSYTELVARQAANQSSELAKR